jgi:hypothetical protein
MIRRAAAVAIGLAIGLAQPLAWSHTFPSVHTAVIQVERCEVAVLIGYTAGTGEPTERVLARAASQPASHALDALRSTLAAYAMAPFTIAIDGAPVAPSQVRAKIGLGTGGTRPTVVVLATVRLPAAAHELTVRSTDPRTTRMSWQDRESGRIDLAHAPAPDHWFLQASSFSLPLRPATGAAGCAGVIRRAAD